MKTWGGIESQHRPRTLLPIVATSRWYISRSLKVIEFWGEKRQKLMKRKNSNPTCMISAVMGRKGKSSICIMYILCPATIKSDLPFKLETRSGHKTCFGDRVHGKYCNFDQSRSRHSSGIWRLRPAGRFKEKRVDLKSPGVVGQLQRTHAASHLNLTQPQPQP